MAAGGGGGGLGKEGPPGPPAGGAGAGGPAETGGGGMVTALTGALVGAAIGAIGAVGREMEENELPGPCAALWSIGTAAALGIGVAACTSGPWAEGIAADVTGELNELEARCLTVGSTSCVLTAPALSEILLTGPKDAPERDDDLELLNIALLPV